MLVSFKCVYSFGVDAKPENLKELLKSNILIICEANILYEENYMPVLAPEYCLYNESKSNDKSSENENQDEPSDSDDKPEKKLRKPLKKKSRKKKKSKKKHTSESDDEQDSD